MGPTNAADVLGPNHPLNNPLAPPTGPSTVALAGSTTISTRSRYGRAGQTTVTGDDISLNDTTNIDATGATAGGTVLIGGDWQGTNGTYQATTVYMGQKVTIDASATDIGNGGKVVLWSDITKANGWTNVYGSIYARGGANGGNGGKIETSGHTVDATGAYINAGATFGLGGLWLLDPYDYIIDSSQASAIVSALNSGTSVTIDTAYSPTGSSSGTTGTITNSSDGTDGYIRVISRIAKTEGGDATLTLKAHRMVSVEADITSGLDMPPSSVVGKLNLVLWSGYDYNPDDPSAGGGISIGTDVNPITIFTNGGNLWAGGSKSPNGSRTWLGLTVGDGPSVGSSAAGANVNALNLNAQITTKGGYVLIWAGNGGYEGFSGITLQGDSTIRAGNGDIILLTDQIYNVSSTGGTLGVSTTGDLNLAPAYTGGWERGFDFNGTTTGSTFTLNNIGGAGDSLDILNFSSLGGLVIGFSDRMSGPPLSNSSNITISSPIDISGPIGLFGNDITINAALTSRHATESVILLKAIGDITQGSQGALSATELWLVATIARLTNESNIVSKLAAPSIADISYVNASDLSIGSDFMGANFMPSAPAGIAATGAVNVSTLSGNLVLTESVSTTTSESNGIVLNAGAASAAGMATGGNIVISSNGAVSVGSGGRATLYTGSTTGSLGLVALVGANPASYRYNSNASTTLIPPLGSGLYGIYREAYAPPTPPTPPAPASQTDTSAGVMISTVIANGPSLIPPLPPATLDTSSTLTVNLNPVITSGTTSASAVTTVSSSTTSSAQAVSEATGSSTTSSSNQTGSTTSTQKSSGSGSQSGNSGTASTAASDSETATASQTSTQSASKQGADKPVATTESVTKSAQKAAASTPVTRAAAHAAARARDTQMAHTHHQVGAAPVVAKAELPGSGMVYSNSGELMPAFEPTNAKTTTTSTTTSKSGARQRDVPRAHDVDDLTDPNNPMSVMMLIL